MISTGVYQLRDEFNWLQSLHFWKIVTVDPTHLRLDHGSSFGVLIPCHNYRPSARGLDISLLPTKQTSFQNFSGYREYMVRVAHGVVNSLPADSSGAEIVRSLGDCWSSMNQVYSQLSLIKAQYPVALHWSDDELLEAHVTLLFRKLRSKAEAVFSFSRQLVLSWPSTTSGPDVRIKILYGAVSAHQLAEDITRRISHTNHTTSDARLHDACSVAVMPWK